MQDLTKLIVAEPEKKEGYSASMCWGLEARINGLIPRSFQNFLSTLTNGEVGQANFHFNHSSNFQCKHEGNDHGHILQEACLD